jgi:hypothetical protein
MLTALHGQTGSGVPEHFGVQEGIDSHFHFAKSMAMIGSGRRNQ